jgi:environmental stress-induced protein Ves
LNAPTCLFGGGSDRLLYDSRVISAVKVIRKASFIATPWKNGGGITHEALRVPATGDAFLFRVSVAHIDASGPFSDFAGYTRNMVLLQGKGLALKFGNGERHVLQKIGESVEFDGATPAFCDLLDGPCVDLNFMALETAQAEARVVCLDQSMTLQPSPRTTLIFSIDAPLSLDGDDGLPVRLEPWDLAVVSRGAARLSPVEPGKLSAPSSVFFATITH